MQMVGARRLEWVLLLVQTCSPMSIPCCVALLSNAPGAARPPRQEEGAVLHRLDVRAP